MNSKYYQGILTTILILFLTACGTVAPPTELAPGGEVVEQGIALSVQQTTQSLSQQLNASTPELEIAKINVKKLEPIYIANLPAYHLQGTYNLTITLPRQQVKQKNNRFDIYLQRQVEGKTWRLLKKKIVNEAEEWVSYLIELRDSSLTTENE